MVGSLLAAAFLAAFAATRPANAASISRVIPWVLEYVNTANEVTHTVLQPEEGVQVNATVSFFSYSHESWDAQRAHTFVWLKSPTEVEVDAHASSNNGNPNVFRGYLVEFASGVLVHRGETTVCNGDTTAIGATVDPSRSFLLFSWQHTHNMFDDSTLVRGEIVDGETLRFSTKSSPSGSCRVRWQVVEHDGTAVTRGVETLPVASPSSSYVTKTVNLPASSSPMLLSSFSVGDIGNVNELTHSLRYDADAGQAVFRAWGLTHEIQVSYESVAFTDSTDVRWHTTSFGNDQYQKAVDIVGGPVEAWRAMVVLPSASGHPIADTQSTRYDGDSTTMNFRAELFGCEDGMCSQVFLRRDDHDGDAACELSFMVVVWHLDTPAPTPQPTTSVPTPEPTTPFPTPQPTTPFPTPVPPPTPAPSPAPEGAGEGEDGGVKSAAASKAAGGGGGDGGGGGGAVIGAVVAVVLCCLLLALAVVVRRRRAVQAGPGAVAAAPGPAPGPAGPAGPAARVTLEEVGGDQQYGSIANLRGMNESEGEYMTAADVRKKEVEPAGEYGTVGNLRGGGGSSPSPAGLTYGATPNVVGGLYAPAPHLGDAAAPKKNEVLYSALPS